MPLHLHYKINHITIKSRKKKEIEDALIRWCMLKRMIINGKSFSIEIRKSVRRYRAVQVNITAL